MRVFAEMASEHIEADLQANKQRLELGARVRSVLSGDAISLVYQPIFDLKQAQVVGFESLARFTTDADALAGCVVRRRRARSASTSRSR